MISSVYYTTEHRCTTICHVSSSWKVVSAAPGLCFLVLPPECKPLISYLSDQEAWEYSDGPQQQDHMEWLPHGPAPQRPRGGVLLPASPRERQYVPFKFNGNMMGPR